MIKLNLGYVEGLPDTEKKNIDNLVKIYEYHAAANDTKKNTITGILNWRK